MKDSTSSSSTPTIQPSSTIPVSEETAYINQYYPQIKPQTPAQIRAQGEVTTRIGVLWLVGVICGILSIFGGVSFIFNPENAKDFWVIIGPIISSAVTGTIAFLTGEKQSSKK